MHMRQEWLHWNYKRDYRHWKYIDHFLNDQVSGTIQQEIGFHEDLVGILRKWNDHEDSLIAHKDHLQGTMAGWGKRGNRRE